MKKKILTLISGTLLTMSLVSVLPQNLQPVKSNEAHAATCKAYNTQYISKKGVKEIAASRAKIAKSSEPLSILVGVLGKWAVPVGFALWADKNRVLRDTKVFADAAKQNKRVKITYCQGPTVNLPWFKYNIVN